jgi:hypothetical protein
MRIELTKDTAITEHTCCTCLEKQKTLAKQGLDVKDMVGAT